MNVRCASCGFEHDDRHVGNATELGAAHLRSCPARDDVTMLPWWTSFFPDTFEVGWHPRDVNEPTWQPDANGHGYARSPVRRYRFTEYAERVIIRVALPPAPPETLAQFERRELGYGDRGC